MKKIKSELKKMLAGMMLVCSLLTVFGEVSSEEGIMPYEEPVIGEINLNNIN